MKYSKRIDDALKLETQLHRGQARKDAAKTPYSMHPIAVMCIVSQYTDDEDVMVAALMHDVLEDVLLPYEEKEEMIAAKFGARVLVIVRGVTEDKDPMLGRSEALGWKECKLQYLDTLSKASEESVLVSAADKIHNLMSMVDGLTEEGDAYWQRFSVPSEKLWFYEEVLKVVEHRTNNPIVQELREKIEMVRRVM